MYNVYEKARNLTSKAILHACKYHPKALMQYSRRERTGWGLKGLGVGTEGYCACKCIFQSHRSLVKKCELRIYITRNSGCAHYYYFCVLFENVQGRIRVYGRREDGKISLAIFQNAQENCNSLCAV